MTKEPTLPQSTWLNRVAEQYAGSRTLQIVLSALSAIGDAYLPGAGAAAGRSFDSTLSIRADRLNEIRAKELLDQVIVRVDRLEAGRRDDLLKFIGTERGFDLFRGALEKAFRTDRTEKIAAYAAILCGAADPELDKIAAPEDLLDALAELSFDELLVLRAKYRQRQEAEAQAARGKDAPLPTSSDVAWGKNLKPLLPERLHSRLPFLLKRLERSGFATEVTGAFLDYSGGGFTLVATAFELLEYLDRQGVNLGMLPGGDPDTER